MSENSPKKKNSIVRYVATAFVFTAMTTVLVTAAVIAVVYSANRGFIGSDEDLFVPLLVAGAISMVISVVLGLFLASGVVQPINRISKAASAIRDGDLTARTGLHGDDELAQLGENFDEMAEAIERDRDLERQLIGDVAHELRTPLMAIQATVEAIQDGVFPADDEHLGTISSETRRLGRLVEALLHLNRLESGAAEIRHDTVDMSELVNGLAITHEALAEASGLTFVADIEPAVCVDGDRDLLSQGVANLISNAVRYTPETGVVKLQLQRKDGYASVSVSDTGVGISKKDLDQVFSRFWRADGARASVSGGLGIGLALVKEVVDQHRGNVSVDSVLGEGSTFTINVPLSVQDISRADSVDARRRAKAIKREAEKQRKETAKFRRLQERQLKAERKVALKDQKSMERGAQQLTLFGIRVPLPRQKDNDE